MPGSTALTIGNFDGVHLGHAALVRRARACAGPEGRVVVMAFWPHPITILRPDQAPDTLTTFDRRTELLRDLGFPTANLDSDTMLPADGVYAGVAVLPGGERVPAAVSVGSNPTFGAASRRLEAHLIDWSGPADDYDWPLAVELVAWLRDQVAYRGVEPLIEQIHRDIADTRAALDREGARWRLSGAQAVGAETGAA